MATQDQIAANQANSQYSSGAKTEEGKEVVSGNAIGDGLYVRKMSHVIRPGEDPEEFNALAQSIIQRYQPTPGEEAAFIDEYIICLWIMKRIPRLQTEMEIKYPDDPVIRSEYLGKLCRAKRTLWRDMEKALDKFKALRAEVEAQAQAERDAARQERLDQLEAERITRFRDLSDQIDNKTISKEQIEEYKFLVNNWPMHGPEPTDSQLALFCQNLKPIAQSVPIRPFVPQNYGGGHPPHRS